MHMSKYYKCQYPAPATNCKSAMYPSLSNSNDVLQLTRNPKGSACAPKPTSNTIGFLPHAGSMEEKKREGYF